PSSPSHPSRTMSGSGMSGPHTNSATHPASGLTLLVKSIRCRVRRSSMNCAASSGLLNTQVLPLGRLKPAPTLISAPSWNAFVTLRLAPAPSEASSFSVSTSVTWVSPVENDSWMNENWVPKVITTSTWYPAMSVCRLSRQRSGSYSASAASSTLPDSPSQSSSCRITQTARAAPSATGWGSTNATTTATAAQTSTRTATYSTKAPPRSLRG